MFDEYDAILTPAAPGPAPRGLDSTGNPVFCSTWTYLGTPAVTLPLLQSEDGMPMGVQLVGRRGNDARLLRTARWLVTTCTPRRTRPWPGPQAGLGGAAPQEREGFDMTLVTGIIGIAMLVVFLGIMLWWVPAPPLIIIVVSVLALLIYDFVQTVRYGENGNGR